MSAPEHDPAVALDRASAARKRAKERYEKANEELKEVVLAYRAYDPEPNPYVTDVDLAEWAGVSRMTLLEWLGKRERPNRRRQAS